VIPVAGTPLLTEALWARLLLVLPPPTKGGRPRSDDHPIVAGLLWMMHAGALWREIPPTYGSWHTLYSRYQRWRRTGTWGQISAVLREDTGSHA
jgi:transposase